MLGQRHTIDAAEAAALLRIEADAIVQAAERLDTDAFGRAVELLASCPGKVIIVGAGTSGVVARKIAATMTSTGTPALYVHPSDALHGGLGIVNETDVAIAVSNSGETDEVLVILPYLHSRRVPIIALVGNLDSTLASSAEVALDARADREACPFNLTPTASTAVALAVGDALALTVMQVKGLTPEGFALNHPSGQLGKRLTLRVRDAMHDLNTTPTVATDAPWLGVVSAISSGGLGAVPVVDDDGRLVGIVTDGDLRRAVQRIAGTDLATTTAKGIMTATPVSIGPESLAYDALRLMEDRPSQIAVLPVVDDDGLCRGLVRLHDLVRIGL